MGLVYKAKFITYHFWIFRLLVHFETYYDSVCVVIFGWINNEEDNNPRDKEAAMVSEESSKELNRRGEDEQWRKSE